MATISEVLTIAVKSHQAGQRDHAARLYREILRVNPNHPDALHLLGVIGNETGDQKMAVKNIRQAIALCPNIAEFHNNLGNALQAQGNFQEAVESFQRALELKPGYATAHNNLGNALKGRGELDAAIASYRRALELQPDYAAAHCNLGSVWQAKGELDAAIASYQTALSLNPQFVEAYNNLGNAFEAQGKHQEAERALGQALSLRPNYAEAHNNLGSIFQSQGKLEQAVTEIQKAIELRPNFFEAHSNLGSVYLQLGQMKDAADCFQKALDIQPNHAASLFELSNLAHQGHAPALDYAARAETLLAKAGLSLDDAAMLNFVVADAREKQRDYDGAFAHYERGSELRRQFLKARKIQIDHEKYLGLIDDMIETFTPAYFQEKARFGLETEIPVFVVGMPRSGTTLTEQILASHPRVFGAGELKQISQIASQLKNHVPGGSTYPRCMEQLTEDTALRLAEEHLRFLRNRDGEAERIVDKMPLNYNHLGLIATLFPNARIIHCRRDPLDTIVSCLRKYAIPSSLKEIAVCYRQYEKLMAHWRQVLPAPIYEVQYEELVANPEEAIRDLIAYCGLDWDDRCLNFHQTERAVQTPSKLEVRQPMHGKAVGRWKRYEKHLEPILESLGLRDGD